MPAFNLHPRAPLHVGEFIGIEREAVHGYIPSDTLFAALCVAWAQLGRDVATRAAACDAQPSDLAALRLSSAFPRAGTVRFYPMPLGLQVRADKALAGKQLKRVRWVSEGVFTRLTAYGDLGSECQPENFLHGGSVWLTASELRSLSSIPREPDGALRLWGSSVVPRVTVDRASNASNLFHSGRLTFNQDCGLWCMADGAGADAGWVEEALTILQDGGIGGLRSVGHGAFRFEPAKATPTATTPPKPGSHAIVLSRYAPAGADDLRAALQTESSAYALVNVGGWCHDDAGKAWRRKTVRMVAEGACVGSAARGHLVDVRPDGVRTMTRPVYRYGLAFLWPAAEEAIARDDGND